MGMKQLLLVCAVVALVGCASTPIWVSDPTDRNNVKIEAAIRKARFIEVGELTQADFDKVTELFLWADKLTELPKGMENLRRLNKLNLGENQLTDVKVLEKLTNLQFLNLGGNQLTDVKPLEKLTGLIELRLGRNQLTDVTGLKKLTWLKELDLRRNPDLTKAQIDELRKALPKCLIWSEHK